MCFFVEYLPRLMIYTTYAIRNKKGLFFALDRKPGSEYADE